MPSVTHQRLVRGSAREVWAQLHAWQDATSRPEPLVLETSGSTGKPKRVVLSRDAMRASAAATHDRLGGPGQWLLALPPSYVAGTQVLFRSLLAGTEPVLLDEHQDLTAAAGAMNGPRRYTSLVPTQLKSMLSSERSVAALRTFDVILVGGAAVDLGLRDDAVRAGLRLVATYGMSETCGGCVYDGLALDGVAVAISTEGRVRVSGPVLFDGYDGQAELTAQVLRDGWFLTADLGRLDEDGLLHVLGRIDDVVISGGVNMPTAAVAARVREHESICAAEVVGVVDPHWGQRVVAVVTSTGNVGVDEIRDFVSDRLPRAWAPRKLVVVDELPVLSNGKADRKALEQAAALVFGGSRRGILRISTKEEEEG